jgi:hypothetical protein
MRHSTKFAVALALLACGSLAGCASTAGGSSSAPSASPSPEPPAVITGSQTCYEDPEETTDAGDLTYVICDWTMADPRLTGTQHLVSSGSSSDPALFATGSEGTLETGGGAWDCKEFLFGWPENGTGLKEEVCRGTGAYAGLTAYVHGVSDNGASDFGLVAWIEED